jgi:imidazolonepropionase-like amidohydrolase
MILLPAVASLALAAPAIPQAAAPSVVLVHAGQLLDRPGRTARGPSTIVIRDGRVVAVHDGFAGATAAEFPGAEVIDLRDRFVLPGLVDSHVHLTSDTGGVLSQLEEVQLSPAAKAYNALANAHKTLAAGFTSVRNLGDRDGVTPAQALEAATVSAADLLGLSTEVGTLEPGKRADLIAVDGDPLRDVTVLKRVPFVMKDGAVFKDDRAARPL